MATTTLTATNFGYVRQASPNTHYNVDNNTWYRMSGNASDFNQEVFLIMFSAFPTNLRRYALSSVRLKVPLSVTGSAYYRPSADLSILAEAFNPSSVTYAQYNSITKYGDGSAYPIWNDPDADYDLPNSTTFGNKDNAKRLAKSRCVAISAYSTDPSKYVKIKGTLLAGGLINATITYDNLKKQTSKIAYKSGPKSGYSNPRKATTFQWAFNPVDSTIVCADDNFAQASATFYWKASTDSSYTSVAITGDTKTVTIPANTFPTASTIQWYVSGTDEDGTTTQTDVFSFSTAAGTASATCVSPVQSVEDGSAPITFRWSLSSTDGQTPSRIRSSWRKETDPDDDQYWHNLFDTTNIGNSFIVPANTFPAGEIRWNIRVWNIDGVEGNRDYKTFICVAAPDAPEGLQATEVPLTTISWQSAEQQAYEISIDGVIVKRYFGTDVYSWKVQEPLSEGDHVISVRVQGQYGFWSQPSEIAITVAGPKNTTVLNGEFETDAVLKTGTYSPSYEIRWYRDGKFIGTSRGDGENPASFVDRHVLGSHSYFTRRFYNNGEDYDQSKTISGTMEAKETLIAPYDGSAEWLSLRLSENRDNEETFTWEKAHAMQRVKGAVYQQVEGSDFESLSANYNCSFLDENDMRRFEALKGKVVILKSRGKNVIVGMMALISKRVKRFYTTYTFSIDQIHVEDYSEQ